MITNTDAKITQNIAGVVLRVSEICDISPRELISNSKQKKIVEARYIIYTYLHYEMRVSSFKIGKYFNRHRINIIRGIRVLKGWMNYHAETKEKVELIISQLKGGD